MTTATQNAGRVDGFKRANDMGIDVVQEWVATIDGRTRHEHRILDGQRRKVGEPFEVEGEKIMYPADPTAPYRLIMNCRCTLIGQIKGFERNTRAYREDKDLDGMTYDEWKYSKKKAVEHPTKSVNKGTFQSDKLAKSMGANYADFENLVNDSENSHLYTKYIDECNGIKETSKRGYYSPALDEVHYGYREREGMNKYGTLAHECNHMFDEHMGKMDSLSFGEIDLINERCKIGSGVVKPLSYIPSSSDEFLSALRKDMEAIRPKLKEVCAELAENTAKRNGTAGIQDALDGFFGTQALGLTSWGHGNKYYRDKYSRWFKGFGLQGELKAAYKELGHPVKNLKDTANMARHYAAASEAWANVGGAVTVGGDELKYMEKYMPETVKAYRAIIGKVV
jgi:hypothetical protein